MMKEFINKELRKLESDDFLKDIEESMLDFLSEFSLEGNNLAFTYRNYKKIDAMVNASDMATKKWDVFTIASIFL